MHDAPSHGLTLSAAAQQAYRIYADHVALVREDGEEVTYAGLRGLAARLAGGYAALGVAAGDRVVVAGRNSSAYMINDHALLWGGIVRAAVSSRLHVREIASIAANYGASAVVVDADRAADLSAALDDVGSDAVVIAFSPVAGMPSVDGLCGAEPARAHAASEDELIWMPSTSGTTGAPKGVMLAHRAILACLRNFAAEMPPPHTSDVVLQIAPLSHLAGWVSLYYAFRGARQLFVPEVDAADVLRTIERHRVTTMPLAPTILNMLTAEAERGDYDLSSIDLIVYAGSPIAGDRLARAVRVFGDVFIQAYGSTEVLMPIASLSRADHRLGADGSVPAHLSSAGRVSPFIDVRLLDDDGAEVAPGEPGEIWARSEGRASGYWNLPEETAEFTALGEWMPTGDVGRLIDGFLYIVDRKKDMIVTGGLNVFPNEVERVLQAVPGVDEAAVVGVPDQRWGEAVLAVVVRAEGAEVTVEQLDAACRAAIAGYKVPKRYEFAESLPKNPTGKLLRRELRERHWAGADRAVNG